MPMYPEHIAKVLINEFFRSRRLVVALFVVMNAAMLAAELQRHKIYTASTSVSDQPRYLSGPPASAREGASLNEYESRKPGVEI
jgi:uncharacterized protein involved in exopolysaccharide biosynthesis